MGVSCAVIARALALITHNGLAAGLTSGSGYQLPSPEGTRRDKRGVEAIVGPGAGAVFDIEYPASSAGASATHIACMLWFATSRSRSQIATEFWAQTGEAEKGKLTGDHGFTRRIAGCQYQTRTLTRWGRPGSSLSAAAP